MSTNQKHSNDAFFSPFNTSLSLFGGQNTQNSVFLPPYMAITTLDDKDVTVSSPMAARNVVLQSTYIDYYQSTLQSISTFIVSDQQDQRQDLLC
jgi:hypothetical protein